MDLVQFLTDPDNLLTAFVGVVCFATLATLVLPMMNRSSLEGRLKSVANRREELRRRSREEMAKRGSGSSLRQTDEGLYRKVVDRLQLSRLLEDPKVAEKMAQAGFRGPRPISAFYFFRFVMPFVFALLAAFYLFVVNDFGLPPMSRFTICVAALLIGYYAPNVYISNIAQKRRESIVAAFPDSLDLLLICVLKGAIFFLTDLMRAIDLPLEIDFMAISSYGASTDSSGVVRILKDLDASIEGRDVLIVEDIIDSGLTLSYLVRTLRGRKPASLEICALLTKPDRRQMDVPVRYVGFEIPNTFVVGYGLDANERFRELPDIWSVDDSKL